jgi:hypothetical protein
MQNLHSKFPYLRNPSTSVQLKPVSHGFPNAPVLRARGGIFLSLVISRVELIRKESKTNIPPNENRLNRVRSKNPDIVRY